MNHTLKLPSIMIIIIVNIIVWRGIKTYNYMKIKNLIKYFIYQGELNIDQCPRTSRNNNLRIYKNLILDHGKGNDLGKARD